VSVSFWWRCWFLSGSALFTRFLHSFWCPKIGSFLLFLINFHPFLSPCFYLILAFFMTGKANGDNGSLNGWISIFRTFFLQFPFPGPFFCCAPLPWRAFVRYSRLASPWIAVFPLLLSSLQSTPVNLIRGILFSASSPWLVFFMFPLPSTLRSVSLLPSILLKHTLRGMLPRASPPSFPQFCPAFLSLVWRQGRWARNCFFSEHPFFYCCCF